MQIRVKLTPGASANEIHGFEKDLFGEETMKVYVTAIPENNKANEALIKLLSKEYDVPKSKIRIIRGQKNREKIVELDGLADHKDSH